MEIEELGQAPILPASEWVWKYRGQTIPAPKSGLDPYLGPTFGWPGGGPFDAGAEFDVGRLFGANAYGKTVLLQVDMGTWTAGIHCRVCRMDGEVVLSDFSRRFAKRVYEGLGGDGGGLVLPRLDEAWA